MIMEKPSCIKELKKVAISLAADNVMTSDCISLVKSIINSNQTAEQKIIKIKELCKEYGK
jgi:hypothetical protein